MKARCTLFTSGFFMYFCAMKMWMITIFALFIFSSCDKATVFEQNTDLKHFEWTYDNIISYAVEINDLEPKNVFINFRHTHFFGFRNVRLKLKFVSPSAKETLTNINIPLSEPNGRWYGDCYGDICDIQYLIPKFEHYIFNETGTYTFSIIQDMRDNPLKNVMSSGLRIEKANKE